MFTRSSALDLVASAFLTQSSRLSRLVVSTGPDQLSRTEAGLLGTLLDGPRRITDLSVTEALAQPNVTRVVKTLEARGLVARAPSAEDGRVVLVSISDNGRDAFEIQRARNRARMRDLLQTLDDEEIIHLARATESLARLLDDSASQDGSA